MEPKNLGTRWVGMTLSRGPVFVILLLFVTSREPLAAPRTIDATQTGNGMLASRTLGRLFKIQSQCVVFLRADRFYLQHSFSRQTPVLPYLIPEILR
jgi:hypothetical protein